MLDASHTRHNRLSPLSDGTITDSPCSLLCCAHACARRTLPTHVTTLRSRPSARTSLQLSQGASGHHRYYGQKARALRKATRLTPSSQTSQCSSRHLRYDRQKARAVSRAAPHALSSPTSPHAWQPAAVQGCSIEGSPSHPPPRTSKGSSGHLRYYRHKALALSKAPLLKPSS